MAPSGVTGESPWVAGVDGCREGWVVVLHDLKRGSHLVRLVPDFQSVLALPEAPAVIAVDIPIGLLATGTTGGRGCEVLARQLLGARASSVFSAPSRAALAAFQMGSGYREVSTANRGGIPTAPGLSQQTFAILPKIAQVDAALAPSAQSIVHEVHPELCFAEANGGAPMLNSKKSKTGRAERAALLKALNYVGPLQFLGGSLPKGAKADDSRGLRMELWR